MRRAFLLILASMVLGCMAAAGVFASERSVVLPYGIVMAASGLLVAYSIYCMRRHVHPAAPEPPLFAGARFPVGPRRPRPLVAHAVPTSHDA